MEFSIPWQNWNIEDIHYGMSQINTRIEDGLFVPIYFADKHVKCQAFHLLSPELTIQEVETTNDGIYLIIKIPKNTDFNNKLKEFDLKNLQHATYHQSQWWPHLIQGHVQTQTHGTYKSSLKTQPSGDSEWRLQIPDSGIFSYYDTQKKSWYGSTEAGLMKRKLKILARTSGLWINKTSFGMDWKLIGAFIV